MAVAPAKERGSSKKGKNINSLILVSIFRCLTDGSEEVLSCTKRKHRICCIRMPFPHLHLFHRHIFIYKHIFDTGV